MDPTMANEFFPRRFRTSKPLGHSVMFTVYYEDGCTGYFVIQGHGTSEGTASRLASPRSDSAPASCRKA